MDVGGVAVATPAVGMRPEAYGTAALTMVQVPAVQCAPVYGTTAASGVNGYFYATGGPGYFDCPVNLPSGSKIIKLDVVLHDADDTADVKAFFIYCPVVGIGFSCNGGALLSSGGTASAPFTGRVSSDNSAYNFVIDKTANLYFVRVWMGASGTTNQFREADLYYRLQVSTPAPGTQTFGDVPPTHPYYKAIEALSASGITGGCGGGNFCPGGNVTRGELAAFLARALGLHFPN
jgi:hypothetical protein